MGGHNAVGTPSGARRGSADGKIALGLQSQTSVRQAARWRIWPSDIAATLQWLPTTELRVSAISDEFCSHTLIDQKDGSRVRVIEASNNWPVAQVRRSLKEG